MSVLLLGKTWDYTNEQCHRMALKEFRTNAADDTNALLNISEGREQDADRTYFHQEWPRRIYHGDGREAVVFSAEEMESHKALGYRKEPFLTPRMSPLSPAEEKASADKRFREQEEMIRKLADTISHLQNQAELKVAAKGKG